MSKILQGHRTKLNKTKKTNKNDRSADSQSRLRRQQLYCAVQSRLPIIVKRQPKKYSLQLATERRQWRSNPDRRRQAVPRTCWCHWEGTITERLTSGGRYDQHGCVSRAQTASSIDIRCPEKVPSKVRRRCSMKTAVGQNAQPECDSLPNSQQWSSRSNGVMRSDRLAEKTKRAAASKTGCNQSCSWP